MRKQNTQLPSVPAVEVQRVVRSQRTKDIENLRITIKVLEREDREIELETARFFLREMKNKERKPQAPNAELSDSRPL